MILSLTFDKPAYHPGDRVRATFELTNAGPDDLLIYARMGFIRKPAPSSMSVGTILVWGPSGDYIPYDAYINFEWQPRNKDFVVLKTNSSVTKSIYVRDAENFQELGTYMVIAVYQNSFDPKDVMNSTDTRIAWKGTVTSNLATFELEP